MALAESNCAGLLADLAQEYERSRAIIEQIEDTLKERVTLSVLGELREPEVLSDPADGEVTVEQEDPPAPGTDTKGPTMKKQGFKQKLVNLFSRKSRSQSSRGPDSLDEDHEEEPVRRISVVNLNSPFSAAPDERRRSIGVYRTGSNSAALQPTSTLQRMGSARGSLESRRNQHLDFQDGVEPSRLSLANRRKSVEFLAGGFNRTSLEVSALAQSNRSNRALLAPNDIVVMRAASQSQLGASAPAAASRMAEVAALAAVREDSFRRRSMTRRGSDHASQCLSRGTSFTTPQLLLQPSSPASSPPAALSPTASITGSLPYLSTHASSRSLLRHQSSGSNTNGMRAHSTSAVAPVAGVYEPMPGKTAGGASTGSRSAVNATGMIYHTLLLTAGTAAATPGAAIGAAMTVAQQTTTSSDMQLPQLSARSSHKSLLLNASLLGAASSVGSPFGAAFESRGRRLADRESGSGEYGVVQEDVGNGAQCGAALHREHPLSPFKGTMGFI